jgi:hypothetical protein
MIAASNPVLENVTISGNTGGFGGGIFLTGESRPTLTNVLLSGNQAFEGGALRIASATPVLTNVTIAGNVATNGSAAVLLSGVSGMTMRNSIVWGNGGPAIDTQDSSSATVTTSIVQGGYPGAGNLDADPRFIAPLASSSAPTTGGDYHLNAASPAINAGSTTVTDPGLPATDLDGNPRIAPANGIVDLGAYELPLTACAAGSFSATGDDRAGPCTLAPAGFYVGTTGATSATPCPPRTTTDAPGAASVAACRSAVGSEIKRTVLRDIEVRLAVTTRPADVTALRAARDAITRSLTPAWWTGLETLSRTNGTKVFAAERDAVTALQRIVLDPARQTPVALANEWIRDLVSVDRAIAQQAVASARPVVKLAATPSFRVAELVRGASPVGAISAYESAWRIATSL